MSKKISQEQIQHLQKATLSIIDQIEHLKHQIRSHDMKQMINHLQLTLSTLRNMSNSIMLDNAAPSFTERNNSNVKVIYNPDGSTRIVRSACLASNGDGWESQFDENLQIRGPTYLRPPASKTK
jgi:hypothetical protein